MNKTSMSLVGLIMMVSGMQARGQLGVAGGTASLEHPKQYLFQRQGEFAKEGVSFAGEFIDSTTGFLSKTYAESSLIEAKGLILREKNPYDAAVILKLYLQAHSGDLTEKVIIEGAETLAIGGFIKNTITYMVPATAPIAVLHTGKSVMDFLDKYAESDAQKKVYEAALAEFKASYLLSDEEITNKVAEHQAWLDSFNAKLTERNNDLSMAIMSARAEAVPPIKPNELPPDEADGRWISFGIKVDRLTEQYGRDIAALIVQQRVVTMKRDVLKLHCLQKPEKFRRKIDALTHEVEEGMWGHAKVEFSWRAGDYKAGMMWLGKAPDGDGFKILQGEMKQYYSSGQLECISNFKDGLPHGETISWWENGVIQTQCRYDKGVIVPGTLKVFDKEGKPSTSAETGVYR